VPLASRSFVWPPVRCFGLLCAAVRARSVLARDASAQARLMSELFLLLDQLLGLAWIFPTLHRNYVSIQRPQKPCLRKQLRAARRQSASLTIVHTNHRRGATFKHYTQRSPKPLTRPLTSCIFFIVPCTPFASPRPEEPRTQETDARNRGPPGNKVAFIGPAYSHISYKLQRLVVNSVLA
jgi:hypothetical protein